MNSKEFRKAYLMVGGTFLPAMILALGTMAVTKSQYKLNNASVFAGIGGLIVGGFVTAKLISDID